jgi:hypothetical protein
MSFKSFVFLPFSCAIVLSFGAVAFAQEQTATTPTADPAKQQEEKAKLEAKATVMLEQVIGEAQALRLPENKVRVQLIAGDLLYRAARARSLHDGARCWRR